MFFYLYHWYSRAKIYYSQTTHSTSNKEKKVCQPAKLNNMAMLIKHLNNFYNFINSFSFILSNVE